ncbi:ABC transporter permease [Terriglobus aquaticus]
MEEEIRFHMEQHAATLIAQGIAPAEAHRQARIAFGGAETSRDNIRSAIGLRPLDELLGDLRYAVRVLRNSPGFTLIAAASLALAIGANTTIFSVAHFMLLERLAVPHPTELRMLYREEGERSVYHGTWGSDYRADNGQFRSDSFPYPVYQQVQRAAGKDGVSVFAFKDIGTVNVASNGTAQAVEAQLVSGNFYESMKTIPELGRGILPADDGAPGTGAVAVISYDFWQRAFGGSRDVLGKVVRVDTFPVAIVGVNAKGFTGADGVQRAPELVMPMSMIATLHGTLGEDKVLESSRLCWIQMMVRKPATMTDAVLQNRLDHHFHTAVLATVTPAAGETVDRLVTDDGSRGEAIESMFMRRPMYILLGLVGCVLLLACANVANLMLARANNRQREISVRLALGAGRGRVFRQLLVESLLLAAIGGAAGAMLGYLGRTAAPALLQNAWQTNAMPIPFNWPIFAFTTAITLLTGILFGLAPAWQSTRTDVNTALKQGAATASRQRKAWTGKGLVAFQIAMATLLVAGSALFLRTMLNLSRVKPGFEPGGLLLFDVQPPEKQYPGVKSVALHRELTSRFAAVPGVDGASAASVALISGSSWNSGVRIEGESANLGDGRHVHTDDVSPEFFQVLRIRMLIGRGFTSTDTQTSPKVTVVNQAFVRKYLNGKNPIGLRISGGEIKVDGKSQPDWHTIIGVCADTQYNDLRTAPEPIYFTDKFQWSGQSDAAQGSVYLVRTQLAPAEIVPALREAATRLDPDLPLLNIRTQSQQIADVSRQERMFATLTAGFGVLALALACVGIYGVMAYTVSQRTHEIGIRLALGAERGRVRRMVLREAGWLAGAGVLVGLGAALGLAQLVSSLLYDTEARDPLSLTVTVTLLLAVSVTASWVPAERAARLEPVIALRQD